MFFTMCILAENPENDNDMLMTSIVCEKNLSFVITPQETYLFTKE